MQQSEYINFRILNSSFLSASINMLNSSIKEKIMRICDEKIAKKGENVGLSFYAFFANKNDDPETLMQVATWWIQTHKLDHFEKATKIKQLISQEN
jgi:mannitol-1-phosphate/altronate dehydrogenase